MSADAPRKRRRWILLVLGAAVLVLGGGVAFVLLHEPGDVSNPNVEFRAEPTSTPAPDVVKDPVAVEDFRWPLYGYSPDRRRALDVPRTLRPPFKRVWTFRGRHLLEFPPVMAKRSLYLLKDNAILSAIDKDTGKVRWERSLGRLSASSPAIAGRMLYVTILERRHGTAGRAVALRARDGRIMWSRDLPSRTESSPVVADGAVYFGTENGTVYALRISDGRVRWTFRASGPVKSGLALKNGKLFFGDYAGRMYAIRQSNGHQSWIATTKGARFGFASGRFYATPAVAYGRVYIGNVDGNVYSFSAQTGRLAWRTRTSGYVYASAAVGSAPGDRPTVYAGSYDGAFYALDARTGKVRWRRAGSGRISGAATLLGDIVYYSDLGQRRTYGLGARTGRKVFEYPRGGYTPVITDGRTLFLVGYGAMYALRPLSDKAQERIAERRRTRRRAVRQRRRAAARRDRLLIRSCHEDVDRRHRGDKLRVAYFRRCVQRRREAVVRPACRRAAEKAHPRRKAAQRRFVRRCVRRRT